MAKYSSHISERSVISLCQQNWEETYARLYTEMHCGVSILLWQVVWKCIPGISLAPNWKQTHKSCIPLNAPYFRQQRYAQHCVRQRRKRRLSKELTSEICEQIQRDGETLRRALLLSASCLWFILQLHFWRCRLKLPVPTSETKLRGGCLPQRIN